MDSSWTPEESERENQDSSALSEGQLYDFITNQPVADSPTERTLQAVARSLVDEYGFDHTQLARDQSISYQIYDNDTGKMKKVRRVLNVVVYPEGVLKREQQEIIRVCLVQPPTTKANDSKKGVTQLEEVMGALDHCDYGLWTNGTDLIFKQKQTENLLQPAYVDLYDLPGYAETAADLDRPTRQVGRIATGDNLQRTFARVHDYIYGNQGLKKDAAFWQVLDLIFCKIHDERTRGKRRFWVKGTERNTPAGQAAIAKRIKELFEEVKSNPTYASVFSDRDTIELNDRVLAFAVGELSRYNLLETDVDVKGAAYEEITSNMLKQQRGQFFTPSNVIKLMVQMMDPGGDKDLTDPNNWPRILDPACGSGRFLTYALDHIRRKLANQLFPDQHELLRTHLLDEHEEYSQIIPHFAEKCLYGIDFDPDLKRAARMNMILNNDGHGNILSFNSLEYPLMLENRTIGELRREYGETNRTSLSDPVRARIDAHLETFDFIFTNPPFGAKIPIDDPNILGQFDLGHRWEKDGDKWIMTYALQSRVPPEILFVERCVRWAKPGTGKIAIVLPDGILGNPDSAYIRNWILTHCQVLASVDLPVETFLPQVGIQTSLLFLRRKSVEEKDAEALGQIANYKVFMAIAEAVGHDRRGNKTYIRDLDGAETIFSVAHSILRRRRDRLIPIEVSVLEKKSDDDLPSIAEAYLQFVKDRGS